METEALIKSDDSSESSTRPVARPIKVKHRILAPLHSSEKILGVLLDGLHLLLRAVRLPVVGHLNPLTKPKNNHFVSLPVNVAFQVEETPLPPTIALELIRRSRHHVVMNECVCRKGRDCQSHSHDIGCLFLGDTGLDVIPQLSRYISEEEATEHVMRALDDGLVPMTARLRADNYAFLLPDHHTVVAICFCCDCCCFMNYYRHVPQERLDVIYPKLRGLEIRVGDKCNGCGACVDTCIMDAISVDSGRAVMSGMCRGCGRCAVTCPNGAVEVAITDPNYFERTVEDFLSIATLE
ncbi:MAG: DUF362 domain-containing protein [Coriobacteriia bacterium]